MKIYKTIKKCRACQHKKLNSVLNLGKQPLANSLRKKQFTQTIFPLHLFMCNKCKLLQINATVSSKYLFSKYLWVTGTSNTIYKYRDFFVREILKRHKKKSNVLEIASNDGFFLKELKKYFNVLGIDPAKNLAKVANKNKIKTLPLFFNFQSSKKIKNFFTPDIIIMRNVFPHIPDINENIKSLSNLMSEDTKLYIEFHNAKLIKDKMHFDYIYHEHIFYFTVKSIINVFNKFKIYPFDIFKSPISGGSYVIILSKKKLIKTKNLKKIIQSEFDLKINTFKYWKNFQSVCDNFKIKVNRILNDKIKFKNISFYGASARGSTLYNYCSLENFKPKYFFDKNTYKSNFYFPGSNSKIKYPKKKEVNKSDLIIILAWNFKKEIISYLRKYCNYKKIILSLLPTIIKEK